MAGGGPRRRPGGLIHLVALVLRRASLEQVGKRLADEGITGEELVED